MKVPFRLRADGTLQNALTRTRNLNSSHSHHHHHHHHHYHYHTPQASLASFPVGAVGECCHGCGELGECKAWTVFGGICYLKNRAGGTVACSGCTSGLRPNKPALPLPPKWPMAGITFTGGRYCPNVVMGSDASLASMQHLTTTGASWISIVVTQYQWNISSTEIFPLYNGSQVRDTTSHYYDFVTLTEDQVRAGIRHGTPCPAASCHPRRLDLERAPHDMPHHRSCPGHGGMLLRCCLACCLARPLPDPSFPLTQPCPLFVCAAAHGLGLKVLLKPHIDLLRDEKPLGRFWRGDVGGCPSAWSPPPAGVTPFTEPEWEAWFASYKQFLLPYAALAEDEGVEMLSLNCELYCPNRQAGRWRTLTKSVRSVFSKQLTVSQISGHEEEMTWWDAVDVIGIDAYYPVPGKTVAEMVASWAVPIATGKRLHQQYRKPVAYTEIGYCSGQCSRTHTPSLADYTSHATHFTAVFEAFRAETAWWLGAFW